MQLRFKLYSCYDSCYDTHHAAKIQTVQLLRQLL